MLAGAKGFRMQMSCTHIAVVVGWLTWGGIADAKPNNPFRVDSTDAAVVGGESSAVDVTIRVPAKHHLYRDMMAVQAEAVWRKNEPSGEWVTVAPDAPCQLALSEPSFPPGFIKPDPADPTATREQYDMDVVIRVPFEASDCASGTYRVDFLVEYQGCKKSLCWMPQTDRVESLVRVRGAAKARTSGNERGSGKPIPQAADSEAAP